ncbi:hypothetical protein Tco_0099941 [Tanacetum coccineum]
MQAEEQEKLSIDEKSKLFVQLLEARKNQFAAIKAKEKRNQPPTKAQKRNTMSTYLKNMAEYKHNQLKNKSFNDIQELFDKAMKRVNTFVDMDIELVEDSEQKLDKDKETTKLQRLIEVVHDKEEVAVDVIPLLVFSHMLKSFDREDLETLWKLVKAKHGSTRPEEGYERVLWGDLKTMFDPGMTEIQRCRALPVLLKNTNWKTNYSGRNGKEQGDRKWHVNTAGTHDDEAGSSSRPKRTRVTETIKEAMLGHIYHENLLWNNCNRAAKSKYNIVLARLISKQIYSPCIMDWTILNTLGCVETIEEMIEIKVVEMGGNEEIFTYEDWRRAFDIREPTYTELCHEFFSAFEFDEVVTDEELTTKKHIKFRLGGRGHSLTLLEFAHRLGLYTSTVSVNTWVVINSLDLGTIYIPFCCTTMVAIHSLLEASFCLQRTLWMLL